MSALIACCVLAGVGAFHRANLACDFFPFFQVYGLLDTLVTDLMVLADELRPIKNVEEILRLCT